jgi:hypothetical protein
MTKKMCVSVVAWMVMMMAGACAGAQPWRVRPPQNGCVQPALPLALYVSPNVSSEHREMAVDAVEAWGDALGQQAFVFTEDEDRASVVIDYGQGPDTLDANIGCEGGFEHTLVTINSPIDVASAYALLQHELGHALGVEHSTNEQSVMQSTVDQALMSESDDFAMVRITESDAATAKYAQRGVAPRRAP